MEKIIRDIVDADREARERIESVKSKRFNIQTSIKEQGQILMEKYNVDVDESLRKQKEANDLELTLQREANEKDYDKSLSSLKKQYDDKKDEWISTIVAHCLKK